MTRLRGFESLNLDALLCHIYYIPNLDLGIYLVSELEETEKMVTLKPPDNFDEIGESLMNI